MYKFLIIILLVVVLLFFVWQTLSKIATSTLPKKQIPIGYESIVLPHPTRIRIFKSVIITTVFGVLLTMAIVLLGMRIKILFIFLPLAIYLMSQVCLFLNHLRFLNRQKIWYSRLDQMLRVVTKSGAILYLDLTKDFESVTQIKSFQSNRGIELGYYRLSGAGIDLFISSLLLYNESNNLLFKSIDRQFSPKTVKRFFPIITHTL